MTSDSLSRLRSIAMGAAGSICLIYAVLAILSGAPDPISPWIPGVSGFVAAIIITLGFRRAGRSEGLRASDELYQVQANRAHRIGYWSAILMYPLFGFFLSQEWVTWQVAFAAMGTLTAASYLIPFSILTGRDV